MPKTMIRPLRSWLALLNRLQAPDSEQAFIRQMRDKISEGWQPTDYEADRMERLDALYGADPEWVGVICKSSRVCGWLRSCGKADGFTLPVRKRGVKHD